MEGETTREVLKYCSDEYNFVVLKLCDSGADGEFWTLEKTEDKARARVMNETEAYGDDPEFQFKYYPLIRKEVKYFRQAPRIETQIIW